MRPANRRLLDWLDRAAPERRLLRRALGASVVASVSGSVLSVGALGLLVASSGEPGLRSVAVALVVIELVAFARSPLRYLERRSTHRLGFAAVTTWRAWLTTTVAQWPARRYVRARSGDLLERALGDTDELQDLWVRAVVPVVGTLVGTVLADLVVATLGPWPHFVPAALLLGIVQVIGVAVQWGSLERLVAIDARRRRARAAFRDVSLEAETLGAELRALGHLEVLEGELRARAAELAAAERAAERSQWFGPFAAVMTTLAALAVVAFTTPTASDLSRALALLLALATADSLAVVSAGVVTDVRVSAAAERLEELDTPVSGAHEWNGDTTLHALDVVVNEPARVALSGPRTVAPGRRVAVTGPSGSGKSTLLRVLAGLDVPDGGSVTLGNCPVSELPDEQRPLVYVPSDPRFLDGLLFDALRLGRIVTHNLSDDLARVGLPSDESTRVEGWSRGQAQRLAVVRALATSPAVVVLDEPTSGLGPSDTDAVTALLESAGVTVIVATHDERLVAWCDEVWSLA